jgi:mono/diheme cytochrome c family protein
MAARFDAVSLSVPAGFFLRPVSMSERLITPLIIIALALGTLFALRSTHSPTAPAVGVSVAAFVPDMVPLVTGDEPTAEIFTKAGCAVCHTIPGISGADGRVGPPLLLGATGPARLADPSYKGRAQTVREYVIESVIEPGRFVVPGYPDHTMPTWYGSKLSALALEKIASYLEQQRPADREVR